MTLAHTLVTHDGAQPSRWMLLLHGLLGRGSNLLGLARRLAADDPDTGVVLPDLRMHGDSQHCAPPHTLARAAGDVRELVAALPVTVPALAGHSFGGKVALRLLDDPWPALESVFVLDASPSSRRDRPANDTTLRVIAALGAAPPRFESRQRFMEALERAGIDLGLRQWLAKNLVRDGAQYRFAIDLDAIAELLADYDRNDLWPIASAPPPSIRLAFAIGGRSASLSAAEQSRLRALARRGVIALHELPKAGHWVHVDDPDGVLRVLQTAFD